MRAKASTCQHAIIPSNFDEGTQTNMKMTTLSQSSSNNSIGSPSSGVPAKRRRCVKNAAAVTEDQELQEEDDDEEIRNRRIQYIVDTAKTSHSPMCSPSAAGGVK